MSAARLHEIELHLRTQLDAYRELFHLQEHVEDLERRGGELSRRLGTRKVVMINTAAAGGGVAEMLPQLCSFLNQVGVHTRWLVLESQVHAFFSLTKGLHNMIHGAPGWEDLDEARRIYEEVSQAGAEALQGLMDPDDILIVHDPQPAGLLKYLPEAYRSNAIWRCHIGLGFSNEHTRRAWRFLLPYVQEYPRVLFSVDRYIPDALRDRAGTLSPSIDPLSHKNRDLDVHKVLGILRASGLQEGTVPHWAAFEAKVQRYDRGQWTRDPLPGVLENPILLQVSRFDRLKGFQYLIPGFERLMEIYPGRLPSLRTHSERAEHELSRARLLMAGPDPAAVSDDPEGQEVLDELCRQYDELPADVQERVHILRLPMVNRKQNALIVNALQRLAAVVVQNSVQEGFGLTVTEALWKSRPMVASNVGGIGVQIRPDRDGLLIDDPTEPSGIAEALLTVLVHPEEAEVMGRVGKRRVWEHFLVLTHAKRWVEEVERAIG